MLKRLSLRDAVTEETAASFWESDFLVAAPARSARVVVQDFLQGEIAAVESSILMKFALSILKQI